ncbi:nicotinate-nucleotide--dimethylbenzimidazole phosphoribosyltransferase [Uliginosibacterium sp. 31-16]|uniref:nicotinate-nucleotide--dimethylbenzimidazole phosphoribosyltransferase n=1 Tax=Uliginosibacterium sp. 31-16 TaxID=3068315 RepID=UPI0027400E41|nr:nicotinate-nucleotide--dimethylbenzimidazole phosphoribosyltransferase [Uliginosibacterium sp. 31-16]MDP5239154.1 nicotinate-nucleotide--dimethylbenzimidazole phosphoribosyltransferase [Uliginosibacterium sp. 31-16]
MTIAFNIQPLSHELAPTLQQRIDTRTKPLGSLGRLEALALQVGLIQQTLTPQLSAPRIAVFAGDHGAAKAGVGAYPQEVTAQMVMNFLAGGAAINVLARQAGLEITVIDCGVASEVQGESRPGVEYVVAKQGHGTANYLEQAAMTPAHCDAAIASGAGLIRGWHAAGCNAIGFGEMGIGNTSTASLLTHFIVGTDLDMVIGRGAGLDDAGLARKRGLLAQAAARVARRQLSPLEALAEFGGFEVATMVGAYLAAAEARMLIVVDGFIVTSALLVAHAINPSVLDYCVFAHGSAEPGHVAQLQHLGAEPLLQLGMRLGEGTGAASAFPLIRAALACMNEMAGFEDAGVSGAA